MTLTLYSGHATSGPRVECGRYESATADMPLSHQYRHRVLRVRVFGRLFTVDLRSSAVEAG